MQVIHAAGNCRRPRPPRQPWQHSITEAEHNKTSPLNLCSLGNESAVSQGYQVQILPSTVHASRRRGTHASSLCQKSRQEAARVQEEPVPSLREDPAWQWSASPCRPGTPRGVRQIPLGASPSYEGEAERKRKCEKRKTQEAFETILKTWSTFARGLFYPTQGGHGDKPAQSARDTRGDDGAYLKYRENTPALFPRFMKKS